MDHIPVLLNEVIEAFKPLTLKVFVDGTLGAGGHAKAIAEGHTELTQLIGFDQDPQARKIAANTLAFLGPKLEIIPRNFRTIGELEGEIDGLLLDVGLSSMQLDKADRGMSFSKEGPLDMRMDPKRALTASEILNRWPEEQIAHILFKYGEVRGGRKLARAICKGRPLHTTKDLVNLLMPLVYKGGKTHPLTQIFQALRIAVNDELGALQEALNEGIKKLKKGGRVAVITFHSLEDRIVKQTFKEQASVYIPDPTHPMGRRAKNPILRIVNKKPITATKGEIKQNPRARSAKLRIAEAL